MDRGAHLFVHPWFSGEDRGAHLFIHPWFSGEDYGAHLFVHPWFSGEDCGARLFSFLCCIVFFAALFVFVLCLVYPMLPVALDCPLFVAPSVFSNVYLGK